MRRGYGRSGNLMEKATIAEHEGVEESQHYLNEIVVLL